jgi:translation initiation factor IF-2
MNVTELYRELKMTKDEFFALLDEIGGFDLGERAIKIDDAVAVKIIAAIRAHRKAKNKKSIFATEETEEKEEVKGDGTNILPLPDKISVKDFAEVIEKRVPDTMAILMQNGIMATINETLDYETVAIIAEDLGYTPQLSQDGEDVENPNDPADTIETTLAADKKKVGRAPVIVIMGHVDHGKTTLLDTIRKTEVTSGESGGITQHIGAYQVHRKEKDLTFIDTPGHEAFTTMRARGAHIADIAVLVVAADDGIKPQTIESIHILQEAKLPFVVAINKIDKEGADIERVKKELSEVNLIPEDYGGDTICAPVSALDGKGVDALLDTLLLVADVEKDNISANPDGETVGSIIESRVDKNTGPVSTVLVQNGTLKIGDIIQIGNIPGRVRALKDWQGKDLKEAGPSTPAQVLGLKKAPVVGDVLQVVRDKKVLKKNVKEYDSFAFLKKGGGQSAEDGKKKLHIILRADKLGSLEAIIQSLQDVQHDEVGIDIVQKGLGSITDNDIAMASASGAIVVGFHVGMTSGAKKFAVDEDVIVEKFEIIYELIDFAKEKLELLLDAKLSYEKIGSLKVLAVFRREKTYVVTGGKVANGVMRAKAPVKLTRAGKMTGEGKITQLQKDKKGVAEVKKGSECGMKIEGDTDIEEGDVIECYEAVETDQKLEQ